ncbi:hypothetical protein [Geomonas agri]|uniref:hypothetical protein n=1 Tax=Geomonas agri TaxID=2873702 RepID=UPI001CD4A863|nr:hypothetical protein [Geomonas agri]
MIVSRFGVILSIVSYILLILLSCELNCFASSHIPNIDLLKCTIDNKPFSTQSIYSFSEQYNVEPVGRGAVLEAKLLDYGVVANGDNGGSKDDPATYDIYFEDYNPINPKRVETGVKAYPKKMAFGIHRDASLDNVVKQLIKSKSKYIAFKGGPACIYYQGFCGEFGGIIIIQLNKAYELEVKFDERDKILYAIIRGGRIEDRINNNMFDSMKVISKRL